MLLSLVLWACANKPVDTEIPEVAVDAKTGTMVPEVVSAEPVRAAVRMPVGEPIVRECYADERKKSRASSSSTGAKGGGGYAADPAPSAAPAAPLGGSTGTQTAAASPPAKVAQSKAAAEPAPPPSASARSRTESRTSAEGGGRAARPGSEVASAPATAATGQAEHARRLGFYDELQGGEAEEAPKRESAQPDFGDKDSERSMTAGLGKSKPKEQMPLADDLSRFDWGGKTYLSNDDSMSLASAQRLLWAVQNRGPVKTSEIRPHELLNYFSFDTTPVPAGDTFSVNAVAEQTGDHTLSMAFAVKGMTPERKPLDLTLVLDRSGSMSAEGRMDYLKRGLRQMTGQLERGDRVDVVLFDHEDCTPLENFVVGRDDPSLLADVIDGLKPRGRTDLNDGLREGYRVARSHPDVQGRNRRMLLISDALLNTGEVDTDVVSEIGKSYEGANIRLSAIGVGREFNDKVLDQLTEKGKGAYVYLGSEAVVDRVFGAGFGSLTQTVAHDVHFSLDLPDSLAMEKFYGEEASTVKSEVQPINYYADTTQLFVQDLRMRGTRVVRSDVVRLTAEWTDVDTGAARTQSFTATVGDLVDGDARNLHKGRALLAWTDLILARSLGNDPCGAPYSVWSERVDELGEDAEVAWLDGLTAPLCGARPTVPRTVAQVPGVPYKVKVDADQVIAEVGMRCGGKSHSESLTRGSSVAAFDVRPGSCELVLYGNVPMYASVQVPSTGGDVRCVVRGGRLSCG
jgi:Ca-activated chloride channel family protein